MTDVVLTVGGSGPNSTSRRALPMSNALAGMRSNKFGGSPPAGTNIEFVDYPFDIARPKPKRHRRVIEAARPKLAVAPDVDGRRWTLDRVVDYIEDERIDEYAETVIVVPKEGVDPRDVPDRFRVGIPFQKAWGNVAYDLDELMGTERGRQYAQSGDCHLLGGNPDDQLRLSRETDISVASVDGVNVLIYATAESRCWFEHGQYVINDFAIHEVLAWSLNNLYSSHNGGITTMLHPLLDKMNRAPQEVVREYQAFLAGRPVPLFEDWQDADPMIRDRIVRKAMQKFVTLAQEGGFGDDDRAPRRL